MPSPLIDFPLCFDERAKPVLVQASVSKLAVKTLDKPISPLKGVPRFQYILHRFDFEQFVGQQSFQLVILGFERPEPFDLVNL